MSDLPFTFDEWGRLDGVAIAELVQARDVSPTEVALQASHAISRVDPQIESALEVFEDLVLDPNAAGSSASGALFGVPIMLKDLGARYKGRLQESGSALFRGTVASVTDPFVKNLLSAGLVPIGRSTTAELGLAWDTTTTYTGRPKSSRNPFNLQRTPGGSSGGSAALVAAGAVPIASSSDGGGSTRIPASHCGLVGLKPTRGLCPRPLDSSEYISRISTDGVLARTVRDCATVLDYTTQVPLGGSFMCAPVNQGGYLEALNQPRRKLRVAWSTGCWGRPGSVTLDIKTKVHSAVSLLGSLNCDLVEVSDDEIVNWSDFWESYTINWMSARGQLELVADSKGIAAADLKALLTPIVYRMYEASLAYDKRHLWRMMSLNNALTRAYGAFLDRFDVLLTPAYAAPIPDANGTSSTLRDGDVHEWFGRQMDAARYAILCNEIGAPAISLPAGLGSDQLPIGIQLCGRWSEEKTILQLAADIEQARPEWFRQLPHVHVSRAN